MDNKDCIMKGYDIEATNALLSNGMAEDIDDDVSSINLKKEESFVHMTDENTYNPLVTAGSLKVNDVVYDEKTNHRLRVIDVKDGSNSWTKTITWKDLEDNRIFTTNPGVNALYELKVDGDMEFEVDDDIEFEFHPIDTYFENFTEDMDNVTNEEIRLDVVNNAVDALHDMGYDDDFIGSYVHIEVKDTEDGRVKVEVRGEFNYEELSELSDRLNKVVSKYDKYAYFDMEDSGIASAYILKDQSDYVVNEKIVEAVSELIDSCETREDLKKVYIENIRPFAENGIINTATLDEILTIFDKKLDVLVDDETVNEELEETGEDGWGDEVEETLEDVFDKMDRISYEVKHTVRGAYVDGDTVEDLVDELKVVDDMLTDAIDELEDSAERINESTLYDSTVWENEEVEDMDEKLNASTKTFSQWFDETSPKGNDEFYPFSNYVKTFESAEVLKDATAMDIAKNAHKFYDVYPVDSADREKAFRFASKELGIDYGDLYDAWVFETPIKLDKNESIKKDLKESDEEIPYTKEEVERDLKSFTHNFTNKEGELKCGFEEEKNFGVDILKQHYNVVEVSGDDRRDGTWYHISFAEPIMNESKSIKEELFPDAKREALAKYLNVDVEDVVQTYDRHNFEVKSTGEEYIVADYDTAYELAEQDIRNLYDDLGIESFTPYFQEWIMDYAVYEDWFRDALEESQRHYFEDMDEDEFIEECEANNISPDDEYAIDELVDIYLDSIDNYADEFRSMYGDSEFSNLAKDLNLVDLDKIVEEAIRVDGIAHFIARYDGEEIELDDNLFAYRTN